MLQHLTPNFSILKVSRCQLSCSLSQLLLLHLHSWEHFSFSNWLYSNILTIWLTIWLLGFSLLRIQFCWGELFTDTSSHIHLLWQTRPPTHSPTHIWMQTCRQAIVFSRLNFSVLGKPRGLQPVASWWESRKTCCCFRGCCLFVIFSKVTRDCRRFGKVENT